MSGYQPRKSRNEVVSPGLGGSAWPADGAARATTSAPLLPPRGMWEQSLVLEGPDTLLVDLLLRVQPVRRWSDQGGRPAARPRVVVATIEKSAASAWDGDLCGGTEGRGGSDDS